MDLKEINIVQLGRLAKGPLTVGVPILNMEGLDEATQAIERGSER